jgi:hypothetical protein
MYTVDAREGLKKREARINKVREEYMLAQKRMKEGTENRSELEVSRRKLYA